MVVKRQLWVTTDGIYLGRSASTCDDHVNEWLLSGVRDGETVRACAVCDPTVIRLQ